MTDLGDKILFDFETDLTTGQWMVGNDDILGGQSASSFTVLEQNIGRFAGEISTENKVGFSSVRANAANINLKDYSGLKIRVKGGGKNYHLGLRMTKEFEGVYYRVAFSTSEDNWLEMYFPFEDLVPMFQGREMVNAGGVKPERIDQIGFFIADGQIGPFELLVDWVIAYR